MNFSEGMLKYVKLMLDKVLKVSRRYLRSLLSCRENTRGGGVIFTPLSLRGLTRNRLGGGSVPTPPQAWRYRYRGKIWHTSLYINLTSFCKILENFLKNFLKNADFSDPRSCHFLSKMDKCLKNRQK